MTALAGGCLCGALRYTVPGSVRTMGFCCCLNCRRISGSGHLPFITVPKEGARIDGATRELRPPTTGIDAGIRTICASCSTLVFGGAAGLHALLSIYAGTLDDPTLFRPTVAIFVRDKPTWVTLPPGLTEFQTLPSDGV